MEEPLPSSKEAHGVNEDRRGKSYDVSVRRNKRRERVTGSVSERAVRLRSLSSESFADSAELSFSTLLPSVMVLGVGTFEKGLGHEHRTLRNGNPALKRSLKELDPFLREHS